ASFVSTLLRAVVLTIVFGRILTGDPMKRPRTRPGACVGTRIIHEHFVFQAVEVRASDPLYQVQLLGVRKTAVGKPEFFIEALCVPTQRVPFPVSHRSAIVKRVVIVAAALPTLDSPIGIDEMPVAVCTSHQDKNAITALLLHKLDAVTRLI